MTQIKKNAQHNIAWSTYGTILDLYKTKKFPNTNLKTKNAVYLIPCECGDFYIGETKRPVEVRIKEHKNNVRNYSPLSHVFVHLEKNPTHKILWTEIIILAVEPHMIARKKLESIYIYINKTKCFSEKSFDINHSWYWLLQKHARESKFKSVTFNRPP